MVHDHSQSMWRPPAEFHLGQMLIWSKTFFSATFIKLTHCPHWKVYKVYNGKYCYTWIKQPENNEWLSKSELKHNSLKHFGAIYKGLALFKSKNVQNIYGHFIIIIPSPKPSCTANGGGGGERQESLIRSNKNPLFFLKKVQTYFTFGASALCVIQSFHIYGYE